MFDFVRQASQSIQDSYVEKTAGVGSYVATHIDKLEQKVAGSQANSKPAGHEFYDITPNEPSAILRNRQWTVGEKIEELIDCEEEEEDGIQAEHRVLLQSEREFLLAFASQNFNSPYGPQRVKEQVDDFAEAIQDLISVLNHFFDYGFKPKASVSSYDPQVLNGQSELSPGQDDPDQEILGPLRPKAIQITHYWDLITKYLSTEYQSISYVNQHIENPEEAAETETSQQELKQRKALAWLMIMLNEDQLLYYCFHSIFQMGTFLSYYDENKSFLFKDRAAILEISRRIYENKVQINSEMHQTYQAFLKQSLEQRIQNNQKMKQGAEQSSEAKEDPANQIQPKSNQIQSIKKDNYQCTKGHLMEHKTTTSYSAGYAVCSKCEKDILVATGHYHCAIDEEDYHNHCVLDLQKHVEVIEKEPSDPIQPITSAADNLSEPIQTFASPDQFSDENMKSLGNLGESIHEPIIKLDSNVPVSLPETPFLNSFATGQEEETYQSQVLFDKYRDGGHPELTQLSEDDEEEQEEHGEPLDPPEVQQNLDHNLFSQSTFRTSQHQHHTHTNYFECQEEHCTENYRLTENDCIEQTFTFDKFVKYYQQRYKIEIRTKTPRDGSERCGLCQRPNVSLVGGQKWILPHRMLAGKFKLAEVSGITCAQCSEFMRKHPYVELDANQLQCEGNKTITQTLIRKRKFHKMCELISCDKLHNLYSQDIIQENLSFKRTFLANLPIKSSHDVDQQNQLLMLITGELLKTLNKAITSLDKHLSANSCSLCKANNILLSCHQCKKSDFKIYEIEKYRQCKTCKVKLHSVQKCLLKHKCKK